ncbi:MAG: hypothetical protein GY811_09010 [Myxococcales bacterium]|nr:hypothetical protein [Myxococcales bacterium]
MGSIEQSKDNCGDEANACTECSDSDISCTNGACVPAGSACLDSCDDGCCMGDTCVKLEMQANATCGQASVCETCMGNDNCAQGSCQDGPAWSVTIVSAIIASTDFEGDDWDLFGEGDPKVKGGLGGEPADDFAVPYEDGTLSPAWNYTVGAYTQADLVTKGLFLVFEDDDISFDDPMGDCTFTITQGGLDLGTVTQAVCGPKVTNLKIDFVLIQ